MPTYLLLTALGQGDISVLGLSLVLLGGWPGLAGCLSSCQEAMQGVQIPQKACSDSELAGENAQEEEEEGGAQGPWESH